MLKILRRTFAAAGALLLLFLAVGVLLPGTWRVERATVVAAPRDSLHRMLSRPAAWRAWMPWPESGAAFEGPDQGPGAAFSWDDATYGAGRFTLVASDPPASLRYRVSVEDGAVRVRGRIRLEEVEGGTRLGWSESGDFGWNPLLGYAALTAEKRQGRALKEAMARLRTHVEGRGPDASEAGEEDERP